MSYRVASIAVFCVLMITAVPGVGQAGLGFGDSAPARLDTQHPVLELDPVPANTTIHAGEHIFFHWMATEANPSSDPASYQASVLVDDVPDSTLNWYPDWEDFTWDYTAPEVQSALCRVEVSISDIMGNTTIRTSDPFTILLSTTAVEDVPRELYLSSPRPNPFNPSCQLDFHLPFPGQATTVVHDLKGRRVKVLDTGFKQAGNYTVRWDGRNEKGRTQPGGLYFFVMDVQGPAGHQKLTRRAVLIP